MFNLLYLKFKYVYLVINLQLTKSTLNETAICFSATSADDFGILVFFGLFSGSS